MNCTIGTHQKQLRVRSLALLSVLTALMFSPCTWAQSQSTLLDQGIYAEESLGDLDKAIELYEQILADAEANRVYAAQAQYRVGVCYVKKGLEADAAAAFRKVVDRYPDDNVATMARSRLAKLAPDASVADRTSIEGLVISAGDVDGINFYQMKPSPDGLRVAYTDVARDGSLYVRELGTGKTKKLVNGVSARGGKFNIYPVWSPDGNSLAYQSMTRTTSSLKRVDIHSQEVSEIPVPSGLQLFPLDWSPDGERLLCNLTRLDETSSLALLSVSSGEIRSLISQGWDTDSTALFSPNGRFVAFSAAEDGTRDVFIIAVDGSAKHRITNKRGSAHSPMWSPEGDALIYFDQQGMWAIKTLDGRPQGGAQLISTQEISVAMGWTSDQGFFYTTDNMVSSPYVLSMNSEMEPANGSPEPLGIDLDLVRVTAWSPDMNRIALTNYGDDKIYIYSPVEQSLMSFPLGSEKLPSRLWWSADGSSVLFQSQSNRGETILALNAQHGEIRPLFPRLNGVERIHLSPDGRKMLFYKWAEHRGDGKRTLVVSDVGKLEGRVVASEEDLRGRFANNVRPTFSPDGTEILFGAQLEMAEFSLWIVSTDGTNRRKIASVTSDSGGLEGGDSPRAFIRSATWHPNGLFIAYDDFTSIYLVNLDSGEQRSIPMNAEFQQTLVMQWSPDGRQIGLIGRKSNPQVWVMSNFLPELGSVQ